MTYTVSNIPAEVDRALRSKAAAEGTSLDEAIVTALKEGLGIKSDTAKRRDLSDLAGTWVEDPEFDKAIEELDRVDPELWK